MTVEIPYDRQKEIFKQKCGDIFMISGRYITFHCTLCEMKYNGFGEYATHLDKHFPMLNADPTEEIQIKNEYLSSSKNCQQETVLEESEILSQLTSLSSSQEKIKTSTDSESEVTDVCKSTQWPTVSPKRPIEPNSESIDSEANDCHQPPEGIPIFKCTVCNARCKNGFSFRKHIERHKMQKTYQCPECPKSFYTSTDVRKHLYIHNADRRRFLCTICGTTFLTNCKLKDHMRRHTNQRDYKCSYCEKSFYNSKLLTQHMHVHSNKRQHKCTVCEASFTYRKGLLNHVKLHENKREFKCELCSSSYNQQAGLVSHMKTRHKTA